jgi:Family of unknown function (DUF6489)
MKVTIDIDCTPQEARAFMGLPDVSALQAMMMEETQRRMKAALDAMGPEQLMKMWAPGSTEGYERMQKMFWEQMSSAMRMAGGANPGGPRK